MIAISETYEIVTEESAENGDFSAGFINTWEEISFRDLVKKMRDFPHASSSGAVNCRTWFTSNGKIDYQTGETETRSIYFHRDNSPRLEKYWRKAAAMARQK